jgi:hypothetical protein
LTASYSRNCERTLSQTWNDFSIAGLRRGFLLEQLNWDKACGALGASQVSLATWQVFSKHLKTFYVIILIDGEAA